MTLETDGIEVLWRDPSLYIEIAQKWIGAAEYPPDDGTVESKAYRASTSGDTWRFRSIAEEIQPRAESYFRRKAVLRVMRFWKDRPFDRPLATQFWHRDSDSYALVKVFWYLNDVDEEGGPFGYVLGTHYRGKRVKVEGRVTDSGLAAVIPPDRWLSVTGRAGTLILCDTTGVHRGWPPKRERLLWMAEFVPGKWWTCR